MSWKTLVVASVLRLPIHRRSRSSAQSHSSPSQSNSLTDGAGHRRLALGSGTRQARLHKAPDSHHKRYWRLWQRRSQTLHYPG